jgi:butyrate kinase
MREYPNILIINTGSTTTKTALFNGDKQIYNIAIQHKPDELSTLTSFDEQVDFRLKIIKNTLAKNGFSLPQINMIMCRGGLIKPVQSGVYTVNDKMVADLINAPKQHASNLSAVIGYRLSQNQKPVYIADPVVVDEMQEIARYSGHRLFQRISVFHTLNHKAVARKYANEIRRRYEDLNLIVAHLGGGISVGAHRKGKVIDVNQALDGEGPFSPERSGTLPVGDLVRLAFSGQYTQQEILKMIVGKGGLVSYLNTNNVQEIEKNITPESKEVLQAMAYQVSKSIGEMAIALQGKIDAILLTGGVAHSNLITTEIKKFISFLAPVYIYPGEDEMQALAFNGMLVWKQELNPEEYKS